MVDVDGAGEGARGELAGGDGGEDLAHGVHQVLAQLGGGEQVVHGLGAQRVEHPREEHVRGVHDGEQQQQLEVVLQKSPSEGS